MTVVLVDIGMRRKRRQRQGVEMTGTAGPRSVWQSGSTWPSLSFVFELGRR